MQTHSREQQRRVLWATSISYVVVILDTSIVNVALERIGASLAGGVAGLQWVVNAYTLTFASLLLSGGTLGDRLGARHVYMAGLAVFTVASLWCGAAPSLALLTLGRVLQGMGAALLVPASMALINGACRDARERAAAFGVWAGLGGVAMAAAPLLGGSTCPCASLASSWRHAWPRSRARAHRAGSISRARRWPSRRWRCSMPPSSRRLRAVGMRRSS